MALVDRFSRPLRSLRLSVTDRCNLRCQYCMPEPDYVWLPRESLLTFEEIARVREKIQGYKTDIVTDHALEQVTVAVSVDRDGRTRLVRFLEVEIPIPAISQQRTGAALFAEIGAVSHPKAEAAVELDALLPSILDHAFSVIS